MIYQHKESKAFVHLVSSGNGYCVIAALLKPETNNFLNNKSIYDSIAAPGKVFRGGKKEFKKFFRKSSESEALKAGYEIIPNDMLDYIKQHCESNIFNILNNTDQYIENSIIMDAKLKRIKEKLNREQEEIMKGYKEDGEIDASQVTTTLEDK